MTAGDLITTDYQYEYNNILFGVDTPFDIMELGSFIGYPSLRSSTADAFGMHGGVKGRHYVPTRQFNIQMRVLGQAGYASIAELKRLVGIAFSPRSNPDDELQFVYKFPDVPLRYINCRPVDMSIPVDRNYSLNIPNIAVRFEAADPRHYDLATKTEIASLPTTGGGLDFPIDFPLDFGLGSTNSIVVINGGDAPAHWTAAISGPVQNPRIEATSHLSGQTLHLAFQNMTIVEGETLELNSRDRSITLNGQPRRNALIPGSQWWAIPSFPDEMTIHYTSADDPITASTFSITWSDATWGT